MQIGLEFIFDCFLTKEFRCTLSHSPGAENIIAQKRCMDGPLKKQDGSP